MSEHNDKQKRHSKDIERDKHSGRVVLGDKHNLYREPTVEELLSFKPVQTESKKFFENTVYTLNHALVCLSMDLAIAPWVGNVTQRIFDKRINIWHAHDHDHDGGHHHGHDHHHSEFWHWLVGEGAGDLAAVPVTVAMQYVAPGFMRGIQTVSEPIIGPAFRWSSNRHARKWAQEHGFEPDSPEAKARAKEIYSFEVEHLPQAFMWTGSSSVMNLLVQRALGNTGYWRSMIFAKLHASLWPLITTLSIRSLAPNTAQKIDDFNANNIAEPVTRRVSQVFGVDYESVQHAIDEEHEKADGHHILEASLKLRGYLPEKAKQKLEEARKKYPKNKDSSAENEVEDTKRPTLNEAGEKPETQVAVSDSRLIDLQTPVKTASL